MKELWKRLWSCDRDVKGGYVKYAPPRLVVAAGVAYGDVHDPGPSVDSACVSVARAFLYIAWKSRIEYLPLLSSLGRRKIPPRGG